MAITPEKSAAEKALAQRNELQNDIQLIEENIVTLEKQYINFFEGVISLEPKALRARTDALVRKWWGKPIRSTQFRFQIQYFPYIRSPGCAYG